MTNKIRLAQYCNNNRLYIGLLDEDGYPEADLTVNLSHLEVFDPYDGYVDTNNYPKAMSFIEKNNLGDFSGFYGYSGYCAYPLVHFHKDALEKLAPNDFKQLTI